MEFDEVEIGNIIKCTSRDPLDPYRHELKINGIYKITNIFVGRTTDAIWLCITHEDELLRHTHNMSNFSKINPAMLTKLERVLYGLE